MLSGDERFRQRRRGSCLPILLRRRERPRTSPPALRGHGRSQPDTGQLRRILQGASRRRGPLGARYAAASPSGPKTTPDKSRIPVVSWRRFFRLFGQRTRNGMFTEPARQAADYRQVSLSDSLRAFNLATLRSSTSRNSPTTCRHSSSGTSSPRYETHGSRRRSEDNEGRYEQAPPHRRSYSRTS